MYGPFVGLKISRPNNEVTVLTGGVTVMQGSTVPLEYPRLNSLDSNWYEWS